MANYWLIFVGMEEVMANYWLIFVGMEEVDGSYLWAWRR